MGIFGNEFIEKWFVKEKLMSLCIHGGTMGDCDVCGVHPPDCPSCAALRAENTSLAQKGVGHDPIAQAIREVGNNICAEIRNAVSNLTPRTRTF